MSELISGKEALIALANGEDVEYISASMEDSNYWSDPERTKNFTIHDFYSGSWSFRLKPRTITINGIEAPKPMSIGWGDPDKSRIDIGFNSEDEAEEFFNKFRGFV